MGIPTPEFFLVESPADIARVRMEFPLFVKPYSEGTSKGVTAQSVIRSQNELETMCAELLAQYQQPVLVERFLPGREFTVGIVGTGAQAEAVGIIEVVLREQAEQGVYSYLNKDRCEELVSYERPDDAEAALAIATALDAWRGLGCFDAGRVDLRSNAQKIPEFIEINPLAGLHPTHSDLPIICTTEGIAYDELIRRIMASALTRCGLLDRAPDTMSLRARVCRLQEQCRPMKTATTVCVLHNEVPADAGPDEQDVLIQAAEITATLERLGYAVFRLEAGLDCHSCPVRNTGTQHCNRLQPG